LNSFLFCNYNIYLSLNLINGRLTRLVGGGRPTFTLNELNSVQMYVLDYPKPSTYPTDALSDAYAYEILPRNFNSSSITLRAGVRGGASVLSTNSFFNLPTNLVLTTNASLSTSDINNSSQNIAYTINFSVSPIPVSGSLFSLTAAVGARDSATSGRFSFENSISEISKIISNTIFSASVEYFGSISASSIGQITGNLIQASDYSFSYFGTQLVTGVNLTRNPAFLASLNNVTGVSNPGKYGNLDFSSLNWNSVIGTRKEVPIWMEAMIDNETIAQGNAILCRKMT
jgi:hypothetical protein